MNARIWMTIATTLATAATGSGQINVAQLIPSDGVHGANFGWSVSVSNDTAIVGAWGDNESAYIFDRHHGGQHNWGQTAKLTPSDDPLNAWFGFSVAISGDIAVVGAPRDDLEDIDLGSAYIFARNEGGLDNWGQVAKIRALNGRRGDQFGWCVSVDGDVAAIGTYVRPFNRAWIFARDEGGTDNWGQVTRLIALDDGARLGYSLCIDGDVAVIGAVPNDAAYVFRRTEGGPNAWGQVARLTGGDDFGISVSISDDVAVVGASASDSTYVFARDCGGPDNWGHLMTLTGSDPMQSPGFGYAVSVSDDVALVGPDPETRVFVRHYGGEEHWEGVATLPSSPWGHSSLSLDQRTAVVGTQEAAFVYRLNSPPGCTTDSAVTLWPPNHNAVAVDVPSVAGIAIAPTGECGHGRVLLFVG